MALLLAAMLAAFSLTAGAASSPLNLLVNQIFTTTDTTVSARFIYRLAPVEESNPMPPGSTEQGFTFEITGNAGVLIGPITFTEPGEYRYELYQVILEEKPGYTYDESLYIVVVHVDLELEMELIVYNKDGTKAYEIEFINSFGFIPTDPELMADTRVIKTVIGNPAAPSMFTFKLMALNPADPMPAGSANGVKTITITGAGTAYFGKWSYSQPGTYYYAVSEVNTGETGYTYDKAIFTFTDTISDDGDGQLILTRTVTNDANKTVTSLSFINYYTPPGGPTDNPSDGPATGDVMNSDFYTMMLAFGGALALGAAAYMVAYMVVSVKKNKPVLRYEKI
jgi:pilin isopeptide linkage protein